MNDLYRLVRSMCTLALYIFVTVFLTALITKGSILIWEFIV